MQVSTIRSVLPLSADAGTGSVHLPPAPQGSLAPFFLQALQLHCATLCTYLLCVYPPNAVAWAFLSSAWLTGSGFMKIGVGGMKFKWQLFLGGRRGPRSGDGWGGGSGERLCFLPRVLLVHRKDSGKVPGKCVRLLGTQRRSQGGEPGQGKALDSDGGGKKGLKGIERLTCVCVVCVRTYVCVS